MSDRIPVAEYREMVGIKSPSPSPKRGGIPQALGRLKQGEMNKTEMRYAEHLDRMKQSGDVLAWWFEPLTWRLAPRTSLTPDFLVMTADRVLSCHDVKGAKAIYTDDAKAKTKIAASMFPLPFFICFPRTAAQGGGWDVEAV